jgi:hypothetical protein
MIFPGFNHSVVALESRIVVPKSGTEFHLKFFRVFNARVAPAGAGHAGLLSSLVRKAKARNALARVVSLCRLGGRRERTFEQQRYHGSGFTLATAAIVLWNTVYIERAIRSQKAAGDYQWREQQTRHR